MRPVCDTAVPGVPQTLDIPDTITPSGLDINRPKTISEVLDIHGGQGTPTVRTEIGRL